MTIQDENYLYGKNGVVWATYDLNQAETVRSALLVQNISCELRETSSGGRFLHILAITEPGNVTTAIDFVWRAKSGLCLKPDWFYPEGEENTSFNKWLNAV